MNCGRAASDDEAAESTAEETDEEASPAASLMSSTTSARAVARERIAATSIDLQRILMELRQESKK